MISKLLDITGIKSIVDYYGSLPRSKRRYFWIALVIAGFVGQHKYYQDELSNHSLTCDSRVVAIESVYVEKLDACQTETKKVLLEIIARADQLQARQDSMDFAQKKLDLEFRNKNVNK